MSSLVSVIVPAYNCAGYVAETLQSVLAQDHAEKEVIVVNDGSKDNTLEILRGFGDRIRIIDQKNAGPPAARNAGLAAARGKYIAFVDADDIWVQGKLRAQAEHLDAHSEVAAVFTKWHVWPAEADGSFVQPADICAQHVDGEIDAARSGWLYARLLFDCELLTSSVMVRAAVVQKIGGYDLGLFNGDDYDYWLRISREGTITKLAKVGVLYRSLPGSVSRTPRVTNFEYEVLKRAVQRWGATGPDGSRVDSEALERRLESLQLAHAHTHLHAGDPQIALSVYRSALMRHPSQARLWFRAAQAAFKTVRTSLHAEKRDKRVQ
jgi:glycosyltransferase involved in cell wall biosynthesis